MGDTIVYRQEARQEDREAVGRLVHTTGFFSKEECAIAMELIDDRLARGKACGYYFLFAEEGSRLLGYTCFGPIPGSSHSFDLYWIAVDPHTQGQGLGRKLLTESERLMAEYGARRVYADTSSRHQYKPTQTFYRACGYVQEALLADFYAPGDGKVIFVKVFK